MITFLFVFGPLMLLLRDYFWLCAQGTKRVALLCAKHVLSPLNWFSHFVYIFNTSFLLFCDSVGIGMCLFFLKVILYI